VHAGKRRAPVAWPARSGYDLAAAAHAPQGGIAWSSGIGSASSREERAAQTDAADVARDAEVARVIDDVETRVGPIDLFCSNAGILLVGGAEVPDADWQRIWEVNVMSHVFAARHLVPRMLARGGGYLLNTASAAGLLSQIGSAPYSVTKHAAVGFAEWLSITYGDQGLRVSVLCPQAVRTAMTAGFEGGGVAGVDGMLEPEQLAEVVVAGLRDERFHILPHPSVAEYVRRKAEDPERWIRGMRRLQARFMPTTG
jgi:NAD(P)-dependent dehydrogenase (short-subunit alcohol dehydrogenase family)